MKAIHLFSILILLLISKTAYTQLINLGGNINSSQHETNPVLSPDGKTLYFSRSKAGDENNTNRNIRYSTLSGSSYWQPSVELAGILNNQGWNAILGFIDNGNTVFLAGRYMPDGTLKGGFSFSHKTAVGWSTPQAIEIPEMPMAYETQTATISPDGKTIIFSSNFKYGETFEGLFDLYVTTKNDSNEWSKPINLGTTINTNQYETAPFLASDNQTLYFSSNGHTGLGGNDIFMTRRLDSTWTNWSEPQNLGAGVNTSKWESYISVSYSGRYAYVGSTGRTANGNMDIFKVILKPEHKPLQDAIFVPSIENQIVTEKTDTTSHELVTIQNYENIQEEEEIRVEEEITQPENPNIYSPAESTAHLRLENLGENINSSLSEMAPLISPDGKTLFFSRSVPNDWKNTNRNIYSATLQSNEQWGAARSLGSNINNKGWNIPCGITSDGNTLLLAGVYQPDGTLTGGFSVSRLTANGWSKPEALKIEGFPEDEETQAATLSADGKVIIFSSYQKFDSEFYGVADLFVTTQNTDGTWAKPKNLGSIVNSRGFETSPFLSADGVTLYFSTDGHGGYGSQDIFVTKRLDNTWTKWSTPTNLGGEVNSAAWEAYFVVPASGEYAYVGSLNQTFGMMDLFRIKLEKTNKPQPMVLVHGKVFNSITAQPIAATIKYALLSDTLQQWSAHTNPTTGEYQIILNCNGIYGFYAEAEGYIGQSDNLDLTNHSAYDEHITNLSLLPLNSGYGFVLNNVFFDRASAVLKPESYTELNNLVELLQENSEMKIEIGGHTELAHSDITLSQQRAEAVRNYLISKGITENRVTAKGYANTMPIYTGNENLEKNRRVEFKIIEEE